MGRVYGEGDGWMVRARASMSMDSMKLIKLEGVGDGIPRGVTIIL